MIDHLLGQRPLSDFPDLQERLRRDIDAGVVTIEGDATPAGLLQFAGKRYGVAVAGLPMITDGMNDHELLARAAKYAGLSVSVDKETGGLLLDEVNQNRRDCRRWNPLDDDGDALRLVAPFGVRLHVRASQVECTFGDIGPVAVVAIPVDGGRQAICAATRRAMVLAFVQTVAGLG